jgi:hypothetical protein
MSGHHPGLTPTEVRLRLLRAGFRPLPLEGKNPNVNGKDWQKKRLESNPDEIRLWEQLYPYAENTGVLCCYTPFLDIDILNPEAAEAAESLVRNRFDGQYILTRFGNAPKRAIPFQTQKPFAKITCILIDPNEQDPKKREHRIEFLGDGQQVVVDGIHPDTNRPYSWHGGVPGEVHREDLPGIDAEQAQKLVDDIAELLIRQHLYQFKSKPKPPPQGDIKQDPQIGIYEDDVPADWDRYLANLIEHDDDAGFAMALLRAGFHDGATVKFMRAQVRRLENVDEARRQRRLNEIPAMVSSARAKLGKESQPPLALRCGWDAVLPQPMGTVVRGVLHAGSLTLVYGPPKSGKSFLVISLFLAIAAGDAE